MGAVKLLSQGIMVWLYILRKMRKRTDQEQVKGMLSDIQFPAEIGDVESV